MDRGVLGMRAALVDELALGAARSRREFLRILAVAGASILGMSSGAWPKQASAAVGSSCARQTFTFSNFQGTVEADVQFLPHLNTINACAVASSVTVVV